MAEFNVHQHDGFLEETRCMQIIKMAYPQLQKARTMGEQIDNYRVAQNMWFANNLEFLNPIKEAVADIAKLPVENQEHVHVVKYNVNGEYKYHHDYFPENTDYYKAEIGRGGQRVKTALIYLNDNFLGGETEFPRINVKIKPQTGKLVIWENANEKGETNALSMHAGLPVIKGVKYLLTIWIRANKFM